MNEDVNLELCVLCKTSRFLCGRRECLLQKKWTKEFTMHKPVITKLDETFAPPSFFVGYSGYPKINAGPVVTIDRVNSTIIDNTDTWNDTTQEEVLKLRLALFRTKTQINVKSPLESPIIQRSHELLLGRNAVDVEVELERAIVPRITLGENVAPYGPIAPIKKFSITESPKTERYIEKVYYDTDLPAQQAVSILGKEKLDVSTIVRTFSAGMLGKAQQRKLVPTRWSITAVDDILSKQLVDLIKKQQEINDYRVFTNYFFGNKFVILLLPNVWSFEMIEVWMKGAYMNPSNTDIGVMDYELYEGRKSYASNITGAYYAARLAITEYLLKIQRQARILVMREIDDTYLLPLGVWVIRQGIRQALMKEYLTFGDLSSAFSYATSQLNYPSCYWEKKSVLYKHSKQQKKITDYFSKK